MTTERKTHILVAQPRQASLEINDHSLVEYIIDGGAVVISLSGGTVRIDHKSGAALVVHPIDHSAIRIGTAP